MVNTPSGRCEVSGGYFLFAYLCPETKTKKMKPIVLTEDQIVTLTYIQNNGVVTRTDRPAPLDEIRYNRAVFELIDGGFLSAELRSLGDYEVRLTPRAMIYAQVFPGFRLDEKTHRTYALRGALTLAGYALAAVILLLAIIL